jgi:hypothetical protein
MRRSAASAPFFFVAGITHRAGDPGGEASPRFAEQQFAAAYNAGMAVAAMAIRMRYFLAD